jgi:Flp pilus assembly protein protease CpaA
MSYAIWLIFFFLVAMVAGVIGILRYQRSRKKAIADKAAFLKENGKKNKRRLRGLRCGTQGIL